jgi:hypothetical protein
MTWNAVQPTTYPLDHYNVYFEGTLFSTPVSTFTVAYGPGSHTVTVSAVDIAGVESPQTAAVSGTAPACP